MNAFNDESAPESRRPVDGSVYGMEATRGTPAIPIFYVGLTRTDLSSYPGPVKRAQVDSILDQNDQNFRRLRLSLSPLSTDQDIRSTASHLAILLEEYHSDKRH